MLQPQLQDWIEQFEGIKKEGLALAAGLSPVQFNWHPEPGRWSIAECLDHLNVIGFQLLPLMDEAIDGARRRGLTGSAPFDLGIVGRWFSQSQEPPVKKKFKTMKLYVPPPDRPYEEIVPAFGKLQDDLVRCIERADGLNLERIKISSPAAKIFRMNLAGWFAGTASHERRHLWQAQNVRDSPGFPKG